jgi:antitoxin (DNA-binding transcriptional repressor) of toxin-antitoxin stability system
MKSVNVHYAKTQLSGLLAEIEDSGAEFVICRNGEPVADLVPHKSPRKSRLSMAPDPKLGALKFDYDSTAEVSRADWPEHLR